MSDDEFVIQKQAVHGRDESPARLLGWTIEEILTMFGVAAVLMVFQAGGKTLLVGLALTFLYLRKLKSRLPDRYLQNLARYKLRTANGYNAAGRDSQWRSPILPD